MSRRKLFAALVSFVQLVSIGYYSVSDAPAQRRQASRRSASTRSRPKPVTQTQEPAIKLEPRTPDPDVEAADVSITANIRARSLIFEAVPSPKVEFFGQPARDTVWEAKRENLPSEVQPGVTYRNIGIRLKITSVFRDIDRIVAEALGEVPISDNAKPAITPLPSSTTRVPAPVTAPTASQPPPRER